MTTKTTPASKPTSLPFKCSPNEVQMKFKSVFQTLRFQQQIRSCLPVHNFRYAPQHVSHKFLTIQIQTIPSTTSRHATWTVGPTLRLKPPSVSLSTFYCCDKQWKEKSRGLCLSRIGLWGSISFEALMRLFLCCCVEFGLNPSVNFGDGWENSWARGGIRLCCKYLLRILQLCLIGTTKR